MKRLASSLFSTNLFGLCLMLAANLGCSGNNTAPAPEGGCPPEACGFNGVKLADQVFGELDLKGAPNAMGFSIADFQTNEDRSLALEVAFLPNDTQFVARDPQTQELVNPVGGRIVLHQQNGNDVSEWIVYIDGAEVIERTSTHLDGLTGYRLRYADPSNPTKTSLLCNQGDFAFIIAGERYDNQTLAIEPDSERRYFRLACVNDLLGKTKRMSYDPLLGSSHAYATTVDQRRATLGMLRADYCGTGQSFTHAGTPLYWKNQADWMRVGTPDEDTIQPVEAGWNEHGATCLGTPRLDEYTREDIEIACGRPIPMCTPELLAKSEWVTWLP